MAIEPPPDLAEARRRYGRLAANVEVLVADAATTTLPRSVDAVLFLETHDLMRTPAAVRRAVEAGRREARVVAFGPASDRDGRSRSTSSSDRWPSAT